MATKRKNRYFNPNKCGVTHFVNKVGGKWKVVIIYCVHIGFNRFSTIQRAIPHISKQMLINQLRELEEDNVLERTVFPEIPPRVEYNISKYGKSLLPMIKVVEAWGLKDMKAEKASCPEA